MTLYPLLGDNRFSLYAYNRLQGRLYRALILGVHGRCTRHECRFRCSCAGMIDLLMGTKRAELSFRGVVQRALTMKRKTKTEDWEDT